MKGRSIVLDSVQGREAAALIVDGKVEDLLIDSPDAPRPGTVYRAIADRPIKGQGGMFLRTPAGTAFLRQVRGVSPGEEMLVQVSGYAELGKAIPVTNKLLFKSRYAIVTPGAPGLNVSRSIRDEARRDHLLEIAHDTAGAAGVGVILRSCCEEADDDEIADDLTDMLALGQSIASDDGSGMETLAEGDGPHILAWRDWTDPADVVTEPGGFGHFGVLDLLDSLDSPLVSLGSASCYIEPTRALVAVDVNTGADGSLAGGLRANLAVARELPRQLRLRGLGGQIVMDLAPLPRKDRRRFEDALRAAFRMDVVETQLVGWTPLGHYELQRKRARLPIKDTMT